ncbi:MAG: iron-containing alcohol dehydrogenase family protein [Bacillota bacterium]|jgi:glycerol dehydrogenase|nr:iron-containing alcohol dehydrogenase family protein [Bacillota bacterium]
MKKVNLRTIEAGPGRYVRGEGILLEAGTLLQKLGPRTLIAGGRRALAAAGATLQKSLDGAGISVPDPVWFGGECHEGNIRSLAAVAGKVKASFLIGVGGGKALDTAKAAAYHAGIPVVTVPTIAATCAATTGISILYTQEGEYLGISRASQAPAFVLCDLGVIGQAPDRYLRAGIGDTAAKWYEFDAAYRKLKKEAQSPDVALTAAWKLSGLCFEVLCAHAEGALAAAREHEVTADLANVVDAVIFLAGMVSEFAGDQVRSAAAHAIYGGLTLLPATRASLHGEVVAFAVLVQLIMEEKPRAELEAYVDFCLSAGLPTTFSELGLGEINSAELRLVAEQAASLAGMENMPFPVTPELVERALWRAWHWKREFRGGGERTRED